MFPEALLDPRFVLKAPGLFLRHRFSPPLPQEGQDPCMPRFSLKCVPGVDLEVAPRQRRFVFSHYLIALILPLPCSTSRK